MPLEPLPQFKPGDDSLINAAVANKLVDAINAILSLTVSPDDAGVFRFEKGKSVLDLTPAVEKIAEAETSGATVRVMCVVQSDDDPPVYTAVPYDLKGDAVV